VSILSTRRVGNFTAVGGGYARRGGGGGWKGRLFQCAPVLKKNKCAEESPSRGKPSTMGVQEKLEMNTNRFGKEKVGKKKNPMGQHQSIDNGGGGGRRGERDFLGGLVGGCREGLANLLHENTNSQVPEYRGTKILKRSLYPKKINWGGIEAADGEKNGTRRVLWTTRSTREEREYKGPVESRAMDTSDWGKSSRVKSGSEDTEIGGSVPRGKAS